MRKQADNIFTFGVGTFLIVAANIGTEIWPLTHWIVSGLVIFGSIVSITIYGEFGFFWATALKHLDVFGPNCERHDLALEAYEESAKSVEPFKKPSMFFLSFAGSVMLMSGLLLQKWYVPLSFEIIGSAVGYGFIHYFQINRFIILDQIVDADKVAK